MPSSREVNHWFMILAGTVIVAMISPAMGTDIVRYLRKFFESAHDIPLGEAEIGRVLGQLAGDIAFVMVVPVLLLVIAAFATGIVLSGQEWGQKSQMPLAYACRCIAG